MKIRKVELIITKWQVPCIRYAKDWPDSGGEKKVGVLRILTDSGFEGNAFMGSYSHAATEGIMKNSIENAKEELLGQNPLLPEKIWQRLWRVRQMLELPIDAISAIDVALWDIVGKVAGLPLYQILGGYRSSVQAYASSCRHDSPEKYAEDALYWKDQGYKAYKIHPGGVPKKEVIAICEQVKKAVGDGMILMLDCSQAYTYETALAIGKTIEALDFYWYEDPVPGTDIFTLKKLSQQLSIPIAATDADDFHFHHANAYILNDAVRIIRSDARRDGITGLKKLASLSEAFGIPLEIHHGGNSAMNFANLQVILSIRNCSYYEMMVPPDIENQFVLDDIIVDKAGIVHAPDKPGIGFEIDWEMIQQ